MKTIVQNKKTHLGHVWLIYINYYLYLWIVFIIRLWSEEKQIFLSRNKI